MYDGREYEVTGYRSDGRAVIRPANTPGAEEWVPVQDCEPLPG